MQYIARNQNGFPFPFVTCLKIKITSVEDRVKLAKCNKLSTYMPETRRWYDTGHILLYASLADPWLSEEGWCLDILTGPHEFGIAEDYF